MFLLNWDPFWLICLCCKFHIISLEVPWCFSFDPLQVIIFVIKLFSSAARRFRDLRERLVSLFEVLLFRLIWRFFRHAMWWIIKIIEFFYFIWKIKGFLSKHHFFRVKPFHWWSVVWLDGYCRWNFVPLHKISWADYWFFYLFF